MGNAAARLRPEIEHDYPPPDYEPEGDRVTLSIHSGGKIVNGEHKTDGGVVIIFKYDHVRVKELTLDGIRKFAAGLHSGGDFSVYMAVGNHLKLVKDETTIAKACDSLSAYSRELLMYVVDKNEGDEMMASDGSSGEDELANLSEFSDSDEPYEYDMREEESDSYDEEDVAGNFAERANKRRADQNAKGKEKVVATDGGDDSTMEVSDEDVDVIQSGDELISPRGSDEDEEYVKQQLPMFDTNDIFNPKFKVGMVFSTKQEMKLAIQSYAINEKRSIKFPRNDKRRLVAKCADENCKWILRGLPLGNESSFRIRELAKKHTCKASNDVENVSSTWLAKKYKEKFVNDPNRNMKASRLETAKDLKVQFSTHQAYKARKKAIQLIEGTELEQYTLLWSFQEEILRSNPGSTVVIEADGSDGINRFDRIYICLHALKEGFIGACRPVICLDGCWLKGAYGGVLLVACGVDGNNNYLPIAYAVVKKETTDTWSWFLAHLKHDLRIQDPTKFTLMSDKQKDLIQAEQDIFPGAELRYCARHLMANFQSAGFKGWSHKKIFWKAAKCTTVNQFERVMDGLHKDDPKAVEWLRSKPPTQWCRAFFSTVLKCDILTNNACETFNGNILEARKKPILSMLQDLHMYLMSRFQRNRDMAAKSKRWKDVLCPRILEIMDGYHAKVLDYVALKSNANNFQVNSLSNDFEQYNVDLDGKVCGCRKWQLSGLPCIHAYAAINHMKYDLEKYIHSCYMVGSYRKAYELPILPINSPQEWPKTNHVEIKPPTASAIKKGRPVTERRRGENEDSNKKKKRKKGRPQILPCGSKMRRQQDTVTCSKCGTRGHNIRRCKFTGTNLPNNEGGSQGELVDEIQSEEAMLECTTQANAQQSQRTVQVVIPATFVDVEDQSQVINRPIPSILKDGRTFMTVSNLLKKAAQDRVKKG